MNTFSPLWRPENVVVLIEGQSLKVMRKEQIRGQGKGEGQTRTTHRVSSLRAFWSPKNTFTAES